MKFILTLGIFTILTGCVTFKSAKRVFDENPVATFTNLDDALKHEKKRILFIVCNDYDSILYNAPITKILKFDTTRADILNYKSLSDHYSVLKLYRREFNGLINNPAKYNSVDSLKEEAIVYSPNKPFLFVSDASILSMYGEMPLESPKAKIHDLIWVFMGP